MLDRILRLSLGSVALAGTLVAAGCGTSTSTSPEAAATAPIAPGVLTGTIIELPAEVVAQPATASPAYAAAASPKYSGPKTTNPSRLSPPVPRAAPMPMAQVGRTDARVRPVAANEPEPATAATMPIPGLANTPIGTASMVPQMPLLRAPLRTPRMVAAIQQAEEHNQRGIVLANRGASYSARAEFISALKAISQALDTETGSAEYSRAMAAGMRALEESEDFVPRGSRLSGEIDMAMIVRSHRTPIKREVEAAGMSPSIAAQQYQRYAADRLGVSVGGEVAGSLALHSVGKLFGQFAHDPSNSTIDAQGKAIAFQRAALVADPNNYLAANELAVLVAHQGNFAEARDLLLRAISLKPQPSMWHNLSVIHAKLGETELADLAQRTAMSAAGGANPGNVEAMAALQAVRWVDPATFSQMSPPPADLNPAPSGSNPPEAAAKAPPAGNQKGISRWAPWGTRQQ